MKPATEELAADAGERLHRFHGGLRLRHNKKISCQQPVTRPPLPEQLVIPLLQHSGQPATCEVTPGQQVLKGDLLGRLNRPGAAVHAPTSGTIHAIEMRPMAHATGQEGLCVILRSDGNDRWNEPSPIRNWAELPPKDLRQRIREAGIVGLGGAVFPTAAKLDASSRSPIHTLVLNGAECEPYISCDEMLMREHPRRVVEGALVMLHAVAAQRAVIAIEDQMGAVQKALTRAARDLTGDRVEVVRIPTIYPEGGERQLVQTLTGMEVPYGGHPSDLGLLCQNVATAAAAREAVFEGRPLIERYVTVTGNGVQTPRNILALIGTPVGHLIDRAGGYTSDVARLVVGGPMMGYPLQDDDEPVVKATNCLLALSTDDIRPPQPEMPCIRCGDCSRVCPAQLMPQELHFHLRAKQWNEVSDRALKACIECGCCDFVCPSHIPLTSWFRYGKGELSLIAREREFAERSRGRFEAREQRLSRAKEEKAERLARRKKGLQDDAERKRQVKAAIERVKARGGDPEEPR